MTSLPPFLVFYAGALLVPLARGRLRAVLLLAVPLAGALNLLALADGASATVSVFGYGLDLIRVDRLSMLFGLLFHLAAFLAFLFSLHLRDGVEHTSAMIYAGSALGAVYAGDLITLFLFWEMLAVTSAVPDPDAADGSGESGGDALFADPSARRADPALGRADPPSCHRFDRLRGHRTRRPGDGGRSRRVAHLRRLRRQVRLSPASQLADRRLSGGDADGHGLPQRLHDEGGGLCVGPVLRRGPRRSSTSAPS